MQPRAHSLLESIANVAIGLGLSVAVTLHLFPALGYPVTAREAWGVSALFTALSVARTYCVRRAFEWWRNARG